MSHSSPATNADISNAAAMTTTMPSRFGNAWTGLIPIAIGIAIALLLHFLLPSPQKNYYIKVAQITGIVIVLAVSLNIVNGMTGQFSIGHAGFMTLGGYMSATITYYGSMLLWGSTAKHGGFLGSGEWLFAASCLAGGLFAAVAGYVVGLPSLRLRGDYLAIVTLGFGEIIRVVLQQTAKVIEDPDVLANVGVAELVPPPLGGSLGFSGIPKYTSLFWVYAILTVTLVVAWRLKSSSIGRAMISVREDEIAAQAMGVNIARKKVMAFVIAAFFAGIGGGLFAHSTGAVSPKDAGFQQSFDFVIMTVLGGRGSISGVTIAAILLTVLPELLRDFEQYRLIIYALLLVIMMLVRPQGLLGIHEIWDLWPRRRATVPAPTATSSVASLPTPSQELK